MCCFQRVCLKDLDWFCTIGVRVAIIWNLSTNYCLARLWLWQLQMWGAHNQDILSQHVKLMLKCTAQIETASISQHQQTSWCKERKIENHLQGCRRCEASRRSGSLMALYNRGGQARRSIYIWAYNISTRRTLTKGVHGGRGEGEGGTGRHARYEIRGKTKCLCNKGRPAKGTGQTKSRTDWKRPGHLVFFFLFLQLGRYDTPRLQVCRRNNSAEVYRKQPHSTFP